MKVFVWIGVHTTDKLMGDVYVSADNLEQARDIVKVEFIGITHSEFWQRIFEDEPTSIFENPMAWIDEYCDNR